MPTWSFDAIGTRWQITSAAALSAADMAEVTAVVEDFDCTWSRFRSDSLVTRLSHGGSAPIPKDAAAMFSLYRVLSAATAGAVTPLIGDSLAALGYDAAYSLRPDAPRPAPTDWERIVRWDAEALQVREATMIDVGAVGKGRLVDCVVSALTHLDGTMTVNAGGDIASRGSELRVALEHPYDAQRAIGVATIVNGAICGSAINRRAWGDGLHHVLDGRTGQPVTRWAATWAMAPDAMTADAVATALFFDGGVEFAAEHGAEWVRMATDGRVFASPSCSAHLFVRQPAEDL